MSLKQTVLKERVLSCGLLPYVSQWRVTGSCGIQIIEIRHVTIYTGLISYFTTRIPYYFYCCNTTTFPPLSKNTIVSLSNPP